MPSKPLPLAAKLSAAAAHTRHLFAGVAAVTTLLVTGCSQWAAEADSHAQDSAMKALGKRFEHHTFAGAGHGLLGSKKGRVGLTSPQRSERGR